MIALVCGGRDFDDRDRLYKVLDRLKPSFVIQGGARGADAMAGEWAVDRGVPMAEVRAQWDRYGKQAGPMRNGWMLMLKPDVVVAFDGGRGTADMVQQARSAGIRVILVVG